MDKLGVMVGFLSTNIEKSYFDDPQLAPKLVEVFRGDAYAEELRAVIQEKHGFDLFEELSEQTRVTDVVVGRKAQAAAYQLIARHVIAHMPVSVGFGYSVGQAVLARAAEAIGNLAYEDEWAPLYAQMFAKNFAVFQDETMKCAVLFQPDDDGFAEAVKAAIAQDYKGLVFIRDYRPPYSLTLGGEANAMDELFERLKREYPGVEQFSLAPFRADASHTDWIDHSQTLSAFKQQHSTAPSIRLCGVAGNLYERDSHCSPSFAEFLARSALGTTEMSAVYETMKDNCAGILFVGSERVARFTFYGMQDVDLPIYLIDSDTLDLKLGPPMRVSSDPAEGLALWRN